MIDANHPALAQIRSNTERGYRTYAYMTYQDESGETQHAHCKVANVNDGDLYALENDAEGDEVEIFVDFADIAAIEFDAVYSQKPA